MQLGVGSHTRFCTICFTGLVRKKKRKCALMTYELIHPLKLFRNLRLLHSFAQALAVELVKVSSIFTPESLVRILKIAFYKVEDLPKKTLKINSLAI